MIYVCDICGWEYDETKGYPEADIPAGTKWEEVPPNFICPVCAIGKEEFSVGE